MEKFADPKFDFAKHVCEKHKIDKESVLSALDLYSKCFIDDEQLLQVLQWLPETPRVTLWKAYRNVNARC